jgi:hypothetical protein
MFTTKQTKEEQIEKAIGRVNQKLGGNESYRAFKDSWNSLKKGETDKEEGNENYQKTIEIGS